MIQSTFADRFDAAFDRLRGRCGLNLVPLARLRATLPDVDRATFDRELWALRFADRFVLHTHDGRHGRPSEADQAAAIVEGERVFVYVARRVV